MFGIGRKEIDYVREAAEAVRSLDSAVIDKLPDELRFRLIRLTGPLPQFEGEIRGVTRLAEVLKEGYKPYVLPNDYGVAVIDRRWWHPLIGRCLPSTNLNYSLMIPPSMIGEYGRALDLGLFECLAVASPALSNFMAREGSAVPPLVMLGLIRDNFCKQMRFKCNPSKGSMLSSARFVLENGTGFLIAAVPAVNS